VNPQNEAYERFCKSVGDMSKENERLKAQIEMMRGTPPPTWEQTCLKLSSDLADSRKYVIELESRLRALWDKYDGDRKYYMDRINRLEKAGDALKDETWPTMFDDDASRKRSMDSIDAWIAAKEANP
jgi:hypothetical protein